MEKCFQSMKELEKAYHIYVETEGTQIEPLIYASAMAQATWRSPPQSDFLDQKPPETSGGEEEAKALVPQDEVFRAAIRSIAIVVEEELVEFPSWKAKLNRLLVKEFGLESEGDDWFRVDLGAAGLTRP